MTELLFRKLVEEATLARMERRSAKRRQRPAGVLKCRDCGRRRAWGEAWNGREVCPDCRIVYTHEVSLENFEVTEARREILGQRVDMGHEVG